MRDKASTTEFWDSQSVIFVLIPAQWMVDNNWL